MHLTCSLLSHCHCSISDTVKSGVRQWGAGKREGDCPGRKGRPAPAGNRWLPRALHLRPEPAKAPGARDPHAGPSQAAAVSAPCVLPACPFLLAVEAAGMVMLEERGRALEAGAYY